MSELRIGKSLNGRWVRLPLVAVTETFAILGKRGGGKTHTASVLAEEMLELAQHVVVIDPLDVWYGLRALANGKGAGYPVVVFGGSHGDFPLNEDMGKALADLIVEERIPAVLSLRHMRKNAQKRFVTDFAEQLYHRKGEPALRDIFAQEMRVLGDAPWALDEELAGDEGLSMGTCEACTKRTDAQRELFDKAELAAVQGNGKKQGGPRCLDGACFYAKTEAYVRGRFHALGEKHPDLILVHGEVFVVRVKMGPEMTLENEHLVEVCKKKDEGARKCLWVGGVKAGRDFWGRLKIDRGDSEPPKEKKVAAEVSEENGGSAEFLHWKEEAGKVLELLDAAKDTPGRVLSDLNLVCGLLHSSLGYDEFELAPFESMLAVDLEENMLSLEKSFLGKLSSSLNGTVKSTDDYYEDLTGILMGISAVCGFEYEDYVAAEAAEGSEAASA